MISLDAIDRLTGAKLGTFDLPCPICSPHRSTPAKRRKPVLRIWRVEPGFATYHCVHCCEHGHVHARNVKPPDPARLAKVRAETAARDRASKAQRRQVAKWLWSCRRPIAGTIAERYLREARGYGGLLPPTLGFLPASREHAPAVIAAFGLAHEVESVEHAEHAERWDAERLRPLPSINDAPITAVLGLPPPPACTTLGFANDAVFGVHLIQLLPDGSDRRRDIDDAKITIGRNFVAPIALAPPNDLLALTIAEGIEDALNDHQATGRGAWAAGSASRMPALAAIVPGYIESVTVLVDGNKAGRDGSTGLAAGLYARGIEALLTPVAKAVTP